MANRQRAEARRKAAAKAARQEGGSKVWLWSAVGAIVAVALIVVIVVTTSGDDDSAADGSTSTSVESSFPDSQEVTLDGEPLARFDDAAAFDDAVGTPAPKLSGFNFKGEEIVIDPAANGPYMLVFLAHWCPHCNAEVPVLLDWKNSGAVPAELNIVGVATAVSASAPNYPPYKWFSNKGWSWPVLVDQATEDGVAGVAATAFGASGWPYFVIIGEDGTVKARGSGEKSIAELQAIVDEALSS